MTKNTLNRAQRRKLEKQNRKQKPTSKSHLQLLPTLNKDNSTMAEVMHPNSMNQKQPSPEEVQQANLEQRYAQNQQYLHNIKAKYVDTFSNVFKSVAITMFNSDKHSNKTEEQILEGAKDFTNRLKEATIAYGNSLMDECPIPTELAESNKDIENKLKALDVQARCDAKATKKNSVSKEERDSAKEPAPEVEEEEAKAGSGHALGSNEGIESKIEATDKE